MAVVAPEEESEPGNEVIQIWRRRARPVGAEVYGGFARIAEAERQAASVITMSELVNRLPAQAKIAAPNEPGK